MSEQRRNLILDAAIRLIEREGPSAMKQTRVAAEAGVEQGHLTYYFPKKADLVMAVFARVAEQAREDIIRIFARANDGDRPRQFLDVAKGLAKDRKRTRLLLMLLVGSHADANVARSMAEHVRLQRQVVGALLLRPPDSLEVELVVAALKGIAVEQVFLHTDPERVDALVAMLENWVMASETK